AVGRRRTRALAGRMAHRWVAPRHCARVRRRETRRVTPFKFLPAVRPNGVIASIPHTGTWLPDTLRARLASDAMRALPMTDWHLHELYDFLPGLGVSVVHATV